MLGWCESVSSAPGGVGAKLAGGGAKLEASAELGSGLTRERERGRARDGARA